MKLKPCPFCGGIAAFREIPSVDDVPNAGGQHIECCWCGASTQLRFACGDDPKPLLAESWNRRTDQPPAVQPERCCLDYPRCDCNSPPEPDSAPTLQPCGHPWKAQHDFKCILCSSPGDATYAQLAETQRFPHSAETESISRAMCREDLPFLAATAQPVLHGAVKFY
jgi:hypothetical protein